VSASCTVRGSNGASGRGLLTAVGLGAALVLNSGPWVLFGPAVVGLGLANGVPILFGAKTRLSYHDERGAAQSTGSVTFFGHHRRTPFELGWSPSAASSTPAFTGGLNRV
jgi:hypothetical protein